MGFLLRCSLVLINDEVDVGEQATVCVTYTSCLRNVFTNSEIFTLGTTESKNKE